MIKLSPMAQSEYDDYYPTSLRHLSEEMAKGRGVTSDEMMDAAKKSFETLLPAGNINVPDQYLYNILDIIIEPESRGKGYGKLAMSALEEKVKGLDISRIALNVFGHNKTARKLYESLGYETVSSTMMKTI
jgi:ribosomal protein S18 acetylase RimI-like enzyme